MDIEEIEEKDVSEKVKLDKTEDFSGLSIHVLYQWFYEFTTLFPQITSFQQLIVSSFSLREFDLAVICECPPDAYFCNNGECFSSLDVVPCDGVPQCPDNSDELFCPAKNRAVSDDQRYKQPEGLDVAVTIVFPTIFACIILVAAMLLGIKKCRQWELDRVVEMRRTRRLIQRMTQTLREKNFRTLQAAYTIRKRQKLLSSSPSARNYSGSCSRNGSDSSEDKLIQQPGPPPHYSSKPPFLSGTSPPPSYDDALFDTFFRQIFD